MRKLAIALAAALLSTSALAANDGNYGTSSTGVSVSSGAVAVSKGNGGALTTTSGFQNATAGTRTSSGASYFRREGHASVAGIASTSGGAVSETLTWGKGAAASGTIGEANAHAKGGAYFDTHRRNPEGFAAGGALSVGKNAAGTASYGNGYAIEGNRTSNVSTFSATAWGNRDGGYFGVPTSDHVATSADATSVSTSASGGYSLGNGVGAQYRKNFGAAGAVSHAESGNQSSNN